MKYCRPTKKIFHLKSSERARKTLHLQKAGNVNLHHKHVFIKKLFRVSSESLQIFKVFGGFSFRFEVLNVVNYES